jgi:2-polyprenyl-6-hydroxyphenyl methylase/3-demethylubiquinone-9 3-methyltransferase
MDTAHAGTIETRFAFGENWLHFLRVLSEERIREAERSLHEMLECESLANLTFLDLGSGSGLSSLAAYRLGASRIHSLDLDPGSVGCTQELRSRYAAGATNWTIERANVLDVEHIRSLGTWDVVYSWGVLHHTGNMRLGLENAALSVAPAGRLFIAIYNDRGSRTDRWRAVKRLYNRLPRPLRMPYVGLVMAPFELKAALASILKLRPHLYIREWTEHKQKRGMSRWHDMVDWVGGYPFEVASPDAMLDFYRSRGFILVRLATDPGINQFVFQRPAKTRGPSFWADAIHRPAAPD